MTCPVYLFNLLCKRLDYENEEIASKVLSTFELQETEMEKYCGNVEAINKKNMYEEHKNAIIQLNKLNMDLMDLGCTTDFEFSALGFAESIMDRYKELYQAPNPPNNLPRISNEESRVFQDEIKSLQTATKLRQATRRHAQDRAEHMVCLVSRRLQYPLDTLYISTQVYTAHKCATVLPSKYTLTIDIASCK